jgi:hypothetical protein
VQTACKQLDNPELYVYIHLVYTASKLCLLVDVLFSTITTAFVCFLLLLLLLFLLQQLFFLSFALSFNYTSHLCWNKSRVRIQNTCRQLPMTCCTDMYVQLALLSITTTCTDVSESCPTDACNVNKQLSTAMLTSNISTRGDYLCAYIQYIHTFEMFSLCLLCRCNCNISA